MAMLSGFAFFSHQIGSFLGAWLGGKVYDMTGSYDIVWYLSIALAVIAGLTQPADRRARDQAAGVADGLVGFTERAPNREAHPSRRDHTAMCPSTGLARSRRPCTLPI